MTKPMTGALRVKDTKENLGAPPKQMKIGIIKSGITAKPELKEKNNKVANPLRPHPPRPK